MITTTPRPNMARCNVNAVPSTIQTIEEAFDLLEVSHMKFS